MSRRHLGTHSGRRRRSWAVTWLLHGEAGSFSSLAHLCLHLSVAKKKAFFRPNFSSRGQIAMGGRPRDCATGQTYFRGQIAQICPRRSGNRAASRCKQSEKFFPTCAKKGRTAAAKNFGEKTLFHSTTETELAAGGGTQQTRTNTKREPESGVTPENRNQLIFRD
uniref:(northern house mosquito) hypothetical protein n=1 Tax=Culex pipiens TaxID=7175 RepID=A0A8D8E936_CULPI